MNSRDALLKADWIVNTLGYHSVNVTPQNFLDYCDFVAQILKDADHRTLKKYEDQGWLKPFLQRWHMLRDTFGEEIRRDPAMAYIPAHHVAVEFHQSQAKMRYWRGGNRTSKTQSGYIEDYWFATGNHPYRVTPKAPTAVMILAGLPLKDYAPKVFELKMLKGEIDNPLSPLFPMDGKWFNHHDPRKHIITLGCPECAEKGKAQSCPSHHLKSKIYLASKEQGIEVLEAFQVGLMHIDEHVEEEFYQAAMERIGSVRNSAAILTGTPLHGPEAWEQTKLVKLANDKVPYDDQDPESPLAVTLHEIDQFTAGLVPHAEIRNKMRTMDPFEIEARVYGRPAALAKSPVFDRLRLADIRENHVFKPKMGQFALRGVSIEELFFVEDMEFIEATELNADQKYDATDEIYSGVRIWEEPIEGGEYIIGVDSAAGLAGRDRSSAAVIKVSRDKDGNRIFDKVAEYYGLLNVVDYADEAKKLGIYYRTALLAVERTGIGVAVTERLRRQLAYPNLYRDMTAPEAYDVDVSNTYGLDTNERTKPKMVGFTQKALQDGHIILHCGNTISELTAFEQERSGEMIKTRYRGAQGSRDDRVMSLCLAVYVGLMNKDQEMFCFPPRVYRGKNKSDRVDRNTQKVYNELKLINEVADQFRI